MTVAHKDLTGTDLHEVKGASTATVGQVPVSDGAGAAPFNKLTHTSLQTTGNPFGAQLVHVREEQASGVVSTTSSSPGWVTSALNTIKTNEVLGASLSANQVTLPAGTYHFEAYVTAFVVFNSTATFLKGRLQNITAGTTILYGQHHEAYLAATVGGFQTSARVAGRFTLASPAIVALQQYLWASGGTGAPAGLGTEVYADLMIWKLA